jgi:hypothetical protein
MSELCQKVDYVGDMARICTQPEGHTPPCHSTPGLPACPHCGHPMRRGMVFWTAKDGCDEFTLPPACSRPECQAARDDAAIAKMIAAGVIDP